jgi:hypothetical protein
VPLELHRGTELLREESIAQTRFVIGALAPAALFAYFVIGFPDWQACFSIGSLPSQVCRVVLAPYRQ